MISMGLTPLWNCITTWFILASNSHVQWCWRGKVLANFLVTKWVCLGACGHVESLSIASTSFNSKICCRTHPVKTYLLIPFSTMPFAGWRKPPMLHLQCRSAHMCGHLLPLPDPSSACERWGSRNPWGLSSAAWPKKNFSFELLFKSDWCSSFHGSTFENVVRSKLVSFQWRIFNKLRPASMSFKEIEKTIP